jgi:flagellar motor switch protein FliM
VLQQITTRVGRAFRTTLEPLLHHLPKVQAEPIVVRRYEDIADTWRATLGSFTLLSMAPSQGALLVAIPGTAVIALVERLFGGAARATDVTPVEFPASADAMTARLTLALRAHLVDAWRGTADLGFERNRHEASLALLAYLDGDDAVACSRLTITEADGRTWPIDLHYPVDALKPLAAALNAKVHGHRGEMSEGWRGALHASVLNVAFPVRSVLAEPVLPLARLLELQVGDVIPISLKSDVDLIVADGVFAKGSVGASNGRAAIRVRALNPSADGHSAWTI